MNYPFESRWNSLPGRITTQNLTIRLKKQHDLVVQRFTTTDWHKIFTDIDTDSELNCFLQRESALVVFYILEDADTGTPFGCICLRRSDPILCDSVEFHGGAWSTSPGYAWRKFRAACTIIERLLQLNVRVTSKAFNDNLPAIKFLRAIGFRVVQRHSAKPYRYLTLDRRRFRTSAIYRKIFQSGSAGAWPSYIHEAFAK